MKKIIIFLTFTFLFIQVTATENPFVARPLNARAGYPHFLNVKASKAKGLARTFYTGNTLQTVSGFTDYLPLTGGTLTGMLTLEGVDSYTGGIQIQHTSAYRHLITAYADGINPTTGSALQFKVANNNSGGNTAVMTLKGNGYVGIGTTTPFTNLSVGDYAGIGQTNDALGAMAGKDGLVFQSSSGAYQGAAIVGQQIGTYGVDLLLGTKFNGGNELKERMRITNDGNIGVGTSSPVDKFEVAGGVHISGTAAASKAAEVYIDYYSGSARMGLMGPNSTTNARLNITSVRGNGSNPVTLLASDINGNIGIGTTTPFTNLSVGDYAGIGQTNDALGAMAGKDGLVFQSSSGAYQGAAIVGQQIGTYGVDLLLGTKFNAGNELKERMRITNDGNIGIGTSSPTEKLSVNGNIKAKKIIVTQTGWSDYVFDKKYRLRSLSSLESFINQNKHLPEVPSAKEVQEKGISVGENQALLLKKIEELTLYLLEMNKTNNEMKKEIAALKKNNKK